MERFLERAAYGGERFNTNARCGAVAWMRGWWVKPFASRARAREDAWSRMQHSARYLRPLPPPFD